MDDGDIVGDVMMINIDLNLDPDNSSELEAAHNGIEERIRRLEEVTSRARESQRLQRLQISVPERSEGEVRDRGDAVERTAERGKGCKRDYSHLVAKALEMDSDSDVKKDVDNGGSFYDCNICLEVAKDPVLTCCGHLFCWACFYRVDYADLTARECPVCRGDVVDSDITPIYGSAKDRHMSESGSGVSIPPRPRAHRIESIRQQRVNTPGSYVSVAEAVRRIRIGLGLTPELQIQQEANNSTPDQPREQNLGRTNDGSLTDWQPRWMNAEIGGSWRDNANVDQSRQQTLDATTPGTPANIDQIWRRINHESVSDWRQRSRNDNANVYQLRRDETTLSTLARVWRSVESGLITHNNDTTEQPRQEIFDPTTDGSLTDSQQRSMNAEIGGSQRDNATAEQPRRQTLDGSTAESLTNLQRLWMAAENQGSRHNSATSELPRLQNLDGVSAGSLTDSQPLWTTSEIVASGRMRSRHLSRVLSETAASLSSVSFALNNVERLVENLESFIRELTMQRTDSQLLGANTDTLSNTVAVTQTELQTLNSTSGTNLAVSVPSASGTPDASAAVAPLENLEASLAVSDNLSVIHPLSSRRRSFASRVADLENELSQESQRRRMR